MKTTLALAATLLLTAACSTTAGSSFSVWDRDRDSVITRAEFAGTVSGLNGWDTNRDGFIDRAEFDARGTSASFAAWDTNSDSRISVDEYRTGLFTAFDTNRDGFIQRNEFRASRDVWFPR